MCYYYYIRRNNTFDRSVENRVGKMKPIGDYVTKYIKKNCIIYKPSFYKTENRNYALNSHPYILIGEKNL